jgi:glycosyltransferase involved in cell wall biosynthesis
MSVIGKIRVTHIITMLELGGAQQNTLYTVEHLPRSLFEVSLISGPGGILTERAKGMSGLRFFIVPSLVRPVRPVSDAAALMKLWVLLRRLQPHIVHTHSSKAGILGRWAARLAGVPVIIHTFHGYGFNDHQHRLVRRAYVAAERLTAKATTHFIAVARANIRTGEKEGIFRAREVSLIRSGIPIETFGDGGEDPAEMRAGLGIAPEAPVVGMVACFKPQKAPLDFVAVAERVAREVPETRFLMAGDGELRSRIEQSIREKGMTESVKLLGWRDDIPALLRTFQVLALTSLWEGLPRVFPQAMAAGIPIVATRVDGAAEAVEHGVTGYLVEPHDVAGMAAHIVRLLRDPETARQMGLRARERVAEFDIRKMMAEQEDLYRRLCRELPC